MNKMLLDVINDIKAGWQKRELWQYASVMEMKQRYRRSILGPFWISLSLAIMMMSIGILWSQLWNIPVQEYLPYFTVGLLLWTLISAVIGESTQVFIKHTGIIKQIRLPLSYYVFSSVWKNFTIFIHHFVVYILVIIYFKVNLSWSFVLIIPGIMLYFINFVWISACLGILSTRYRDIEQIVPTILSILFFMTPIIWKMGWSGKKALFVYLNPLYHMLEILRAPLLGYMPTMHNYISMLILTMIGMIVSLFLVGKYHKRVSYWL